MTAHHDPPIKHTRQPVAPAPRHHRRFTRLLSIITCITLSLAFSQPALADADDYLAGANQLNVDGHGNGSLDWYDDYLDWWYVDVDVLGDLRFTLSVPSGQDFDIYICDFNGDLIMAGTEGMGVDEDVSIYTPYVGRIYALVHFYNYNYDHTGSYTIRNYFDPDIHPDLSASIDALDEPWGWDSTVNVDINVTNEGNEAAGTFVVRLKASSDTTYGNGDDYQVTSWIAGPLAPGENWTKNHTWTLPRWPYGTMPADGTVYWYVAVDPVSGETDTSDNYSYDGVTMSRANQAPSLVITEGPQGTIAYNDVTFSYSAVDIDGTIVSYEVKLDGAVTPTNTTSVTYNNLANGPHTFEARAVDDDGAYSIWISRSFTVDVPVTPFTLSNIKCEPSDTVALRWDAETGYTYQLQHCEDLAGTWVNLGTPQSVGAGQSEITQTDNTTAGIPIRFYRVVRTPM